MAAEKSIKRAGLRPDIIIRIYSEYFSKKPLTITFLPNKIYTSVE